MKAFKYYIGLLLWTTFIGLCHAQPISEHQATDIAVRFFSGQYPESVQVNLFSTNTTNHAIVTNTWEENKMNYMYAVNMPDSGWVLVAGDERSIPILAVSDKGTFPTKGDMPPAMLWLLEDYVKQIKFIQDSCQSSAANAEWQAIEDGSYFEKKNPTNPRGAYNGTPLLQKPNQGEVKWNQSYNNDISCTKPYNKYCKDWYTPSCGRTYVGCTAVAMAQIMWHWQWPHTGMIHNDIDMAGNPTGTQQLHLYDWSKMPAELRNSTPMDQVDMVAGFLRDCGYAAKMEYGQTGSGASLKNAQRALINTFAYSKDITYKQKNFFSWNWKGRIKNSIDNGCPVLYAGYGSGGHAFVVDGYNSNNQFHINWGWGGNNNGYFELDNLTPSEEHKYNSDHEALFDIKPAPSCGTIDVNGGTDYRIGTGGTVTVSNQTVPNGTTGVYYSGTSVTLRPGFQAKAGSHVHVAIQHFPCDGIAPLGLESIAHKSMYAEPEENTSDLAEASVGGLSIFPNPTDGLLTVQSTKETNRIELYTLSGEKALESRETTLDLHPLPAGMYIIIVHFADGTVHSEKVVKSR